MNCLKRLPSNTKASWCTPEKLLLVTIPFLFGIKIGHIFLNETTNCNDVVQISDSPPALRSRDITGIPETEQRSGKERKWENWPAVAYEEVGHPLVAKGNSFYNHARDLYFGDNKKLINEFLAVYKERPDPVNMCGIRINHAMGLFLAVKELKPTLVVESGVNAGVSTYFIRKASPTTRIFAVDPEEKPICAQGERWIDDSKLTTYYTGSKFVDIMEMDWDGMKERNEFDPSSTLVFLDDHLHAYDRIAKVMKHGIRHILVEDNYKAGEGATPKDKKSTPKQMFFSPQWKRKGDWLFERLATYSEFPPLVPPIVSKLYTQTPRKAAGGFMHALDTNTDIMPPILRPDLSQEDSAEYERIAKYLDIDPSLQDKMSYLQFMNYNQFCYLEILPNMAESAGSYPDYE